MAGLAAASVAAAAADCRRWSAVVAAAHGTRCGAIVIHTVLHERLCKATAH